jgi:hypothetical protein
MPCPMQWFPSPNKMDGKYPNKEGRAGPGSPGFKNDGVRAIRRSESLSGGYMKDVDVVCRSPVLDAVILTVVTVIVRTGVDMSSTHRILSWQSWCVCVCVCAEECRDVIDVIVCRRDGRIVIAPSTCACSPTAAPRAGSGLRPSSGPWSCRRFGAPSRRSRPRGWRAPVAGACESNFTSDGRNKGVRGGSGVVGKVATR